MKIFKVDLMATQFSFTKVTNLLSIVLASLYLKNSLVALGMGNNSSIDLNSIIKIALRRSGM